jgi:three-Cys-motif partner protein
MASDETYAGREQTQVKHVILRNYLERLAHIIGSRWDAINYIDAFSGPWNAQSSDFSDSSFAIAIAELRQARKHLLDNGKSTLVRVLFCERSTEAFAKLREFAAQVDDVEIELINDEFEVSLAQIREFCERAGRSSFTFVFIDPTGWTGFAIRRIAPLLKRPNTEVLINFMTQHITRFFSADVTRVSFQDLYGDDDLDDLLTSAKQLRGAERTDHFLRRYQENLKRLCGFPLCCSAVVLNPVKERPHFHLIYATRHSKRIEVFKKVEEKAMLEMERLRAASDVRRYQTPLLSDEEPPPSKYYRELRQRYLNYSKRQVENILREQGRARYEDLFCVALESPLVWEADLRSWIREWRDEGSVAVEGLKSKRHTLKREGNQFVMWMKASRE